MDWIRGEKLGSGSFATVNVAVPRSRNPLFPPLMAVKSCGAWHSSTLEKERLVLEELKGCPEVIRCYGESYSYENGEKSYNVLLEYASGGALSEKVKNSGDQRLLEFEVRRYTKSLLKGLNFIHKFGYVHCDIKLQNVLLTQDGGLKIADFGLAKRVGSKKSDSYMCQLRGTPLYMSPETVTGGEIAQPADIWALGCAVAEMITGAPAWRYSDLAELLMRIGVGDELPEIPENLSVEGKDFIRKCFVKDSSKRWTAEMLLDHPFVCGDQESDNSTVPLKNSQEKRELFSPSCPLEFSDWISSPAYSEESCPWSSSSDPNSWSVSPAERLRHLTVNQSPRPDWSVSNDWVTIR